MKKLFILYDSHCGLCTEVKKWMQLQPVYLELEFIAAGSSRAMALFPTLTKPGKPDELIVVTDEGAVYRDAHAWILCLYALEDFREWSFRLAAPGLLPFAREAFKIFSRNRAKISRVLRYKSEAELSAILQQQRKFESCDIRPPQRLPSDLCPYCKDSLAGKEMIYCSMCGAGHHRDCWIANKYNCSVYGCQPQIRQGRITNG